MRQILLCTIVVLVALKSFGQQTNFTATTLDYLGKSKQQKKTGTIVLAIGAGLIATSFIIPRGELVQDGICIGVLCDKKYKNDGIKSAFFIAGGTTALGSIPFFIAAKKNLNRARSVSITTEKSIQLYKQSFVLATFPALRINVAL